MNNLDDKQMDDEQRTINRLVDQEIARIARETQAFCIKNSVKISFPELWKTLFSSAEFSKNCFCTRNLFNLTGYDYVMLSLVQQLRLLGIGGPPEIVWRDKRMVEHLLHQDNSLLVLTVHSGFAFPTKLFTDAGKKVGTVALNEIDVRDALLNSGGRGRVYVVIRNKYCLGNLHKFLRDGGNVVCTVDFRDPETGTFDFISPALFRFSAKLKIPLYFSNNSATSHGNFEGTLVGPITGSSDERTEVFIDFLSEVRPGVGYKVRPYDDAKNISYLKSIGIRLL